MGFKTVPSGEKANQKRSCLLATAFFERQLKPTAAAMRWHYIPEQGNGRLGFSVGNEDQSNPNDTALDENKLAAVKSTFHRQTPEAGAQASRTPGYHYP